MIQLETLIYTFDLHINIDITTATRHSINPIDSYSIIDLSLSTHIGEPPNDGTIDVDNSILADHEVILIYHTPLQPLDNAIHHHTEGKLRNLSEEDSKKGSELWDKLAVARRTLSNTGDISDLVEEAQWIKTTVTTVLEHIAQPFRLYAGSKYWGNAEVQEARKEYADYAGVTAKP